MLRSLSVLLTTLGAVLVLIGTGSAAFIGPDDTLVIGEEQVPPRAAGLAVRTHPEVTRFVNIDLLVRAEAEGGVFLASSQRVDTDDLLKGWSYYEITRLSLDDVGGVVTQGPPATRRALRPGRITGWLDRVEGDPEAELVVELDGTPLDVVAVPLRAKDRVTFAIGAHVAGAFWIQVVVAVVGALMVVAGWALRRHLRRRGRRAGDRSDSDGSGSASDDGPRPLADAAPARDGGASGGRTPLSLPKYPGERFAPRAVAAALLPLALVVSGCGVPGSAPRTSQAITRTGISLDEARTLQEDATHVYAPEFEEYPLWALIASEQPTRLRLVTRQRFAQRWQTEARVRTRGELPGTVERAIPPTQALLLRADDVATAVAQWWPSGEVSGLKVDRGTRRTRDALLASGVAPTSLWALDPPAGTPRVRVVEVAGGHLAVLRHTLMTPSPRRLTTVVLFPTTGRPRMLGSSLVEVS